MSLVNKVLRDLDARRAGEGERTALPAAVTPLVARLDRSARWPWIVLGVGAVAAVVGFAFPFLQHTLMREPSVSTATQAQAIVSAQPTETAPAIWPPSTSVVAVASNAANVPDALAVSVSGLRLSEELHQTPEPRQRRPVAGMAAGQTAAPAPPRSAPTSVSPESKASIQRPAPSSEITSSAKDMRAQPTVADMRVDKQERKPSPAEVADANFRRGLAMQRQGNAVQAASFYRQALDLNVEHAGARQALSAMLLEARQFDEAEELLRRGIEIPVTRMASALSLARLKVEKGDAATALDLLLRNSAAGEGSADYQGFAGALLNRVGRSGEAIERYQSATRLAPSDARWWAGLGIALDAGGRTAEAREAYVKAKSLPGLPPDLAQHVELRLR